MSPRGIEPLSTGPKPVILSTELWAQKYSYILPNKVYQKLFIPSFFKKRMNLKSAGAFLSGLSVLAIIIALLAQKNEFIILNLAVPAFAAGIFMAFLGD